MDEAEKRRLKKLGKQKVEQQSREIQALLAEANPAPVGSDAWARNYKAGTLRERELRRSPPDRMTAAEASRDFVLHEFVPGPDFTGVPTWYVECPQCHDLLHTVPTASVACSCAAIRMDWERGRFFLEAQSQPRFVRLIARGEKPRRPWWRFW